MPVPVVVVEIAPPNAPVELARSLVAACSGAIDQGRCSLVADEPDDVVPRAIAIVSWDGAEHLRVRIEVGIRRAERAQWLSRTMSFRAEDDPAERWKAAGLTVATLVGEVVPPSQSAVRPDDARKPAGPPPARSTSAPVDTAHASETLAHRAQLEGGLRLGSGLASGSLRLGALAAIGYRPPSFPLQPWLSAGYAAQVRAPSTVAVSWVTLGAGAAAELAISAAISLRLRSDLLLQRVGVTATDSVQRSTQSGASWKPGWLVGADLLWPAGDSLAWTAGIDAWTTSGQVIVRVEQRTVRTEPIFGVAGRLGARWRWP